ncbi:MFS transporter [Methyloceanibacter sp. wino2]|uniref:spinster family MFS transporter n=1 Tax=Methyloceanibacter sp. wino2 TaxID=2170729 RepID=UPI00131F1FDE|nr:MFS transporter [Methyloceanibacter sp. wino2]
MRSNQTTSPSRLEFVQVGSRRYTLIVLTAYFALAHLDRQVLAVTLSPIGREFALSDIQLGLLSGLAFAVLFSTLGLPLALAVSSLNRRNVIAITIAVWSAMTMLCGLAQNFWQLFLARVGVGVGEAGALPASHAIISDRYEPRERAGAMGVFMSGANIGTALALVGGGFVAQFFGWRAALLLAGLPGLVLAGIIRLTVPEPPRPHDDAGRATLRLSLLSETVAKIFRAPPMALMVLATVLNTITTFGMVAWLPTFLVREHGMVLSAVGLYLAAAIGVAGALGTMFGGQLAGRLALWRAHWIAWTPAVILLLTKPFAIAGLLAGSKATALLLLLVPCALGAVYIAPTIAVLHAALRSEERPVGSALLLFGMNMIGMVLGPLIVGAVSNGFDASGGSLGAGLVAVQAFGITGAIVFLVAGWTIGAAPEEREPQQGPATSTQAAARR